jgi:hypothetical protein
MRLASANELLLGEIGHPIGGVAVVVSPRNITVVVAYASDSPVVIDLNSLQAERLVQLLAAAVKITRIGEEMGGDP